MLVEVVDATREHIAALAPNLRHQDKLEVQAAGLTPHKAIWRGYRGSAFCRTGLVNGEVAAMWGLYATPFAHVGHPWLLTAPACDRIPLSYIRIGAQEVGFMLMLCPKLTGMVDATYHRAIRFLEQLGFKLSREFPYGPQSMPFRMYSLERR